MDDIGWDVGGTTPSYPDLVGEHFDVVQEPLHAGDNFTVNFRIRNAGAAAAGPFRVRFYVSRDSSFSNLFDHQLVGSAWVNSLSANTTTSSHYVSLRLPAPGDPFWTTDTTYYIGMIIDPDNDVDETNESNNANQDEFKDWDRVAISGTSPGPASLVGRAPGGAWWLGRSNGSAFTNQLWGVWSDSVTWQDVVVGDFNGDLRPDIAGRAGGQWWVARSTGNSFVTELWGAWSNGLTWQDVQVGDFDGDGRADIAGRAGGQWWVARSTGSGFTNQLWGAWSTGVAWNDVKFADFDGDGRTDIAGRAGGQWWVAHSTGSVFNNELWTTWSAGDWQDVVLGDFDGDGRLDIAGRLNGQWWATRLVASQSHRDAHILSPSTPCLSAAGRPASLGKTSPWAISTATTSTTSPAAPAANGGSDAPTAARSRTSSGAAGPPA